MHRKPLLSLLNLYTPTSNDELQHKQDIISFVQTHFDCFERTLAVGHITGSAFIVDPNREQTLLTLHRKLNLWLQPGGHADGETDILSVALREAHEETGLNQIHTVYPHLFDIDIHSIPARKSEAKHLHYDIRFLLEANPDEPFVISGESHDLRWFYIDEINPQSIDQSIFRMAQKVKNGCIHQSSIEHTQ